MQVVQISQTNQYFWVPPCLILLIFYGGLGMEIVAREQGIGLDGSVTA